MPSSDSPKSHGRRIRWLAAFVLFLCLAWTGVWFWAAGELAARAQAGLAALNEKSRVNCENLEVKGYPFRLGLSCSSVVAEQASAGFALSAGAFRSAAQIYAPNHVVSELDSPLRLEAPGIQPLDLSYGNLRASVRFGLGLPSRISLETRGLNATLRDGGALFSAAHAEAHARRKGDDLDLAANFTGLKLEPALSGGRVTPLLSGEADLGVTGGARRLIERNQSLRGLSGAMRLLRLAPAADAAITAAGPWSVDEAGLIDAALEVTLVNPQALSKILAEAFPENKAEIDSTFAAFTAMATPDKPGAVIPLRVIKGEAYFGFLPLGSVPPLR